MNLARKNFEKPVEILEAKASYNNWSSGGDQKPEYWETMFYGKTFQMGSVVSQMAAGDVGPFKLAALNSTRGADFVLANTVPTVGHQSKEAGDQIGQFRNLLIWLRPAGDKPFYFFGPNSAKIEKEDGIWFWKLEKTYLALRPINLGEPTEEAILKAKKQKNQPTVMVPNEDYAADKMLKSATTGNTLAGFALEVGEGGDYDAWKKAVKTKGASDISMLKEA